MKKTKVLFVCLGNICRSPMAHGYFRHLLEDNKKQSQFEIDSAGTGDWHIGKPPDSRAIQMMKQQGIDISDLRARTFDPQDAKHYDYILAMDDDNVAQLKQKTNLEDHHKIQLFLQYADNSKDQPCQVPDPYFGADKGFERVFTMIENASKGFLSQVRND